MGAAGGVTDWRAQGIAADELAILLGATKALNRVMILDAADAVLRRPVGEKHSGFALRAAVERWSRAQGIYAIAACEPASSRPANESSSGLLAGLLSFPFGWCLPSASILR